VQSSQLFGQQPQDDSTSPGAGSSGCHLRGLVHLTPGPSFQASVGRLEEAQGRSVSMSPAVLTCCRGKTQDASGQKKWSLPEYLGALTKKFPSPDAFSLLL